MNPKLRTESYAAYDMHRLNSGDGHLHDFYVVIFLQSKIRKMIRVLVGYTQLIMVYNNLFCHFPFQNHFKSLDASFLVHIQNFTGIDLDHQTLALFLY